MKHHWMCLSVLTGGCGSSDDLDPVDSGSLTILRFQYTSDSAQESDSESDTGEEQIGLLGRIGSAMVSDSVSKERKTCILSLIMVRATTSVAFAIP